MNCYKFTIFLIAILPGSLWGMDNQDAALATIPEIISGITALRQALHNADITEKIFHKSFATDSELKAIFEHAAYETIATYKIQATGSAMQLALLLNKNQSALKTPALKGIFDRIGLIVAMQEKIMAQEQEQHSESILNECCAAQMSEDEAIDLTTKKLYALTFIRSYQLLFKTLTSAKLQEAELACNELLAKNSSITALTSPTITFGAKSLLIPGNRIIISNPALKASYALFIDQKSPKNTDSFTYDKRVSTLFTTPTDTVRALLKKERNLSDGASYWATLYKCFPQEFDAYLPAFSKISEITLANGKKVPSLCLDGEITPWKSGTTIPCRYYWGFDQSSLKSGLPLCYHRSAAARDSADFSNTFDAHFPPLGS